MPSRFYWEAAGPNGCAFCPPRASMLTVSKQHGSCSVEPMRKTSKMWFCFRSLRRAPMGRRDLQRVVLEVVALTGIADGGPQETALTPNSHPDRRLFCRLFPRAI